MIVLWERSAMLRLLTCITLGLASPGLQAQESIRFARTPDLSPDGRHVVFSYLGDLWIGDVDGSRVRHLTMHESHDFNPIYSPDGQHIAFSSNRHGNYDVFVIPQRGGRPLRLTHDSADDHVTGWSPDGKSVLFASNRQTDFPPRVELYRVSATGGRAQRVTEAEAREGIYSPDGKKLAYVRGGGTWFRKGYRGSANDDLWISSADGTNHVRLTRHDGQDNHPQFSADGRFIFYASDVLGGPTNIVKLALEGEAARPIAVTRHTDEAVRRLRLCRNGEAIVYECGPDLWLHTLRDGKSRKLSFEIYADEKGFSEKSTTFTSGMTEYALSPDEKHIAFVVQGEIFLMSRNGGKARRLTNSPANDHDLAWAPDSKKLLFLSDRNGQEDVYLLESDDADHPELAQAHRFKVKPLTDTLATEKRLEVAPDGNRVSFLRDGKLVAMNLDGSQARVLIDDGQIFDYAWSPDSKHLCYARSDRHFASELFIVGSTGPTADEPARNVTRYATFNGGVSWSRTGNKLAFISLRRRDSASAYVLSLQKPTSVGAAASKDIDWDDIHLRVKQPAAMHVTQCAISSDGSKVAFRGKQDGDDLWVANADGGQVTRLTTGNVAPTQISWSKYFSGQVYFRDQAGNLKVAMVGSAASNTVTPIGFQARMNVRQDELFQEVFEQSWRAIHDTFYDASFHGVDWAKVRARYRPLVAHCTLKEDLYALISLMVGELNASHLGISGKSESLTQTAELGLLFDRAYAGPGLRIAEILHNGPADRRGIQLRAGEVVVAIDGVPLDDSVDVSELLNDKVNEVVTLSVRGEKGDGKTRRVEIQAGSRGSAPTRPGISELMYERWTRANAERVRQLSGGKLAYIHIPGMNDAGLERFVRALYSDAFDKEGLVLDVRFNGGGSTHEQVLGFFSGKEHTFFKQRGNDHPGLALNWQDRKWTRPIVLLINQRSYSDAEIFPNAFKTLGLGKLVGQTTGAHVIGTREIKLIDGSSFRTPTIGVSTAKGINMEKEGVVPDIAVEVQPDDLARGEDAQLRRAVEVLQEDVAAWRKTHAGPLSVGTPPTSSPGVTPAPNEQMQSTDRGE